ncbi:hypothetical protein BJ912DRAFT_663944 [Pholiota molesta]|nr:hypothetical protein BJ912DRAFT_663944 [Pholiota molesta]
MARTRERTVSRGLPSTTTTTTSPSIASQAPCARTAPHLQCRPIYIPEDPAAPCTTTTSPVTPTFDAAGGVVWCWKTTTTHQPTTNTRPRSYLSHPSSPGRPSALREGGRASIVSVAISRGVHDRNVPDKPIHKLNQRSGSDAMQGRVYAFRDIRSMQGRRRHLPSIAAAPRGAATPATTHQPPTRIPRPSEARCTTTTSPAIPAFDAAGGVVGCWKMITTSSLQSSLPTTHDLHPHPPTPTNDRAQYHRSSTTTKPRCCATRRSPSPPTTLCDIRIGRPRARPLVVLPSAPFVLDGRRALREGQQSSSVGAAARVLWDVPDPLAHELCADRREEWEDEARVGC